MDGICKVFNLMNTEVTHFVVVCFILFDGNGVLSYTNDCDKEP